MATRDDMRAPVERRSEMQCLLVAAPFAMAKVPNLGLSLLQAALRGRGIGARIDYLTLRFAAAVGFDLYEEISSFNSESLLGDWIFAPSLWEDAVERESAYWTNAFPNGDADTFEMPFAELQATVRHLQRLGRAFVDEYVTSTDWSRYAVVGFSTAFMQNVASLALARRIKRAAPHVTVVFGGANCEAEMGAALLRNFDFIDVVFSGEADETFPRFVEALRDGASLDAFTRGVIRRDAGGAVVRPESWVAPVQDLDSLPIPLFDDYFEQIPDSLRGRPFAEVPFETARGCWWGEKSHCTFCGLNGGTMLYRSKSPERALAEILELHARHGRHAVRLRAVDNILDHRYFEDVIPALARLGGGTTVFFETKANLTREQVAKLAEGRVRLIQPGVESLSSDILALMKKGCTMLQNVQLLKWCAEFGVTPLWNIITRFPGERAESYHEMAELLPRLTHLQPPTGTGLLRLDRFSPYFMTPETWGLTDIRPNRVYGTIYPLSARELEDLAYYFEFEDPSRIAPDPIRRVAELVKRWKSGETSGALVGFDRGKDLLVWDTRPIAACEWTVLRGVYREIAVHCDAARSTGAVVRRMQEVSGASVTPERVRRYLQELFERGYFVRERDRFLSVIVLTRAQPPSIDDSLALTLDEPIEELVLEVDARA